jgi:hypothetical protein
VEGGSDLTICSVEAGVLRAGGDVVLGDGMSVRMVLDLGRTAGFLQAEVRQFSHLAKDISLVFLTHKSRALRLLPRALLPSSVISTGPVSPPRMIPIWHSRTRGRRSPRPVKSVIAVLSPQAQKLKKFIFKTRRPLNRGRPDSRIRGIFSFSILLPIGW